MTPDNRLYAGAAVGLILAALAGFGLARMTSPDAPVVQTQAAAPQASADTVDIDAAGIRMSAITVNMGVLAPDTCSLLLTTSAGKIIVQRVTPATPPATTVRKAPISSLVFPTGVSACLVAS